MNLGRHLERILPARMREPVVDSDAKAALDAAALVQAQVRQWQLEVDLLRRRRRSGPTRDPS